MQIWSEDDDPATLLADEMGVERTEREGRKQEREDSVGGRQRGRKGETEGEGETERRGKMTGKGGRKPAGCAVTRALRRPHTFPGAEQCRLRATTHGGTW